MPLIAQNQSANADMSRFAGILAGFDENFLVFIRSSAMSLSARIDHSMPNLAALIHAVRMAANVSQMAMGRNRHEKTNTRIWPELSVPSDLPRNHPKHLEKGHFSLIANIEQGGRKGPIPADFVTYLASVLEKPESFVLAAIAEDARLFAAFSENAMNEPVAPEKTVTVESTVSSRSPETPDKPRIAPGSKGPVGKR